MKCNRIETYYIEAHSKKELKRKYRDIISIDLIVESYGNNTHLYKIKFARVFDENELNKMFGKYKTWPGDFCPICGCEMGHEEGCSYIEEEKAASLEEIKNNDLIITRNESTH